MVTEIILAQVMLTAKACFVCNFKLRTFALQDSRAMENVNFKWIGSTFRSQIAQKLFTTLEKYPLIVGIALCEISRFC